MIKYLNVRYKTKLLRITPHISSHYNNIEPHATNNDQCQLIHLKHVTSFIGIVHREFESNGIPSIEPI